MKSEIITVVLLGEAVNQRTTMETWIHYEGETPDLIEDHELRDNQVPTSNMAIRVLAYTRRKWIVDLEPIKVKLE